MHLNEEEQAMLAGKYGKAKQWAIDHQLKVGSFFDATDMVSVSQAHEPRGFARQRPGHPKQV